MPLFDFDFSSFISGLLLSSFAFLLYWNKMASNRQEKLNLLRKSHDEEQRKKQDELQLLQNKTRLDLQREEFSSSKALFQQRQEHNLRLKHENAKLEQEKESLSKAKKNLLHKENEVDQIRESLKNLLEQQQQAPLKEIIQQLAGEEFKLQKAQLASDLK